MRASRPSPATRWSVLGLLLVLALGPLGGDFHFLFVRHSFCATHQELEHGIDHGRGDALVEGHSHGGSPLGPEITAPGEGTPHDGCSPRTFAPPKRNALGVASLARIDRCPPAIPPRPIDADAPRTSVPLTLLAPNHSPPA